LIRKPEGKRPLGSHRHRWEVNIKINLRGIKWEDVDWIYLAQVRDGGVGSCGRGIEHLDSINAVSFLTT